MLIFFNFQRLATSIEMLDLSHNNISECSNYLHCLVKLKKLNLSFNNLSTIPSLCDRDGFSTIEYLDLSYNNIESIESDRVDKLESLKYLNLKSNLLNSINQLNNLNKLASVTYVSSLVLREGSREKWLFWKSIFYFKDLVIIFVFIMVKNGETQTFNSWGIMVWSESIFPSKTISAESEYTGLSKNCSQKRIKITILVKKSSMVKYPYLGKKSKV